MRKYEIREYIEKMEYDIYGWKKILMNAEILGHNDLGNEIFLREVSEEELDELFSKSIREKQEKKLEKDSKKVEQMECEIFEEIDGEMFD